MEEIQPNHIRMTNYSEISITCPIYIYWNSNGYTRQRRTGENTKPTKPLYITQ